MPEAAHEDEECLYVHGMTTTVALDKDSLLLPETLSKAVDLLEQEGKDYSLDSSGFDKDSKVGRLSVRDKEEN